MGPTLSEARLHRGARTLAAHAWRALEARAIPGYVAGPQLRDAITLARRAHGRGLAATVCFWDDGRQSPAAVHARYLDTLRALADEPYAYLSLKPTALAFDASLASDLAEHAARLDVGLHLDALAPEAADPSFGLAERLVGLKPAIGLTLPGRWRRSLADAPRAAELATRVRVVKGQWVDPEDQSRDPREGVLAVVDRLAGRARTVAIASHDSRLVHEALRRLLRAGTAAELEILLGHPSARVLRVARRLGVPARLYVPYGSAWLPWTPAEVRSRPWLALRICRAAIARGPSDPRRAAV